MSETSIELGRPGHRSAQALMVITSVVLTIAVLGFVSWVAAFEHSPRWNGPVVAIVLAVAMAVLLVMTSHWRHLSAWLACLGLASIGLASGLGRPRDETMTNRGGGGGDVVARLNTWWPLIAIGIVLVLAALVWSLRHSRQGSTKVHLVLTPLTLLGMGVGTIAVTMVLRDLVVGSWIEGRPIRRRHRRSRSRAPVPVRTAGDLWCEAAGHEAAAVVAFTDLAARLTAVGAPPSLVDRCRRAARDEARHASTCDRLAYHFGSARPTRTSSPLEAVGQRARSGRRRRTEIVRLAVESFVDGVVGEGFAAARLEAGTHTVADPWAAHILRRIAIDEREHAALGADIVGWCRGQAPRPVMVALRRSAARLPVSVGPPDTHLGLDPAALRRCGHADHSSGREAWLNTRSEALQWLAAGSALEAP